MREYFNPKLRTNILKDEDNLGTIEQGNLTFLKCGKESSAYIDISDNSRIPILPIWEELDPLPPEPDEP